MPSLPNRTSYSLRKSRSVFRSSLKAYRRRKKRFSKEAREEVQNKLERLREALFRKDREGAGEAAQSLEGYSKTYFKKTFLTQIKDLIFAIGFALLVAVVIRQMWFEFYEIPTGSMRPTLQEKDRLAVSKTTFGINFPLSINHFLFDPSLAMRSGIFLFSGKDMDIPDVDTRYFYLFPGKKQYVKRMMGKPGDTLYFYGGLIYGIDREGNDISTSLQSERLDLIDHVPFIHLDGKVVLPPSANRGIYSPVTLYQMNLPVARMSVNAIGRVSSEILLPKEKEERSIKYYDLWGFKNFAMARLLTPEEASSSREFSAHPNAVLYLELTHHPDVSRAKIGKDLYGRTRPIMGVSRSLLPIDEVHAKKLFDSIYTARFVVKNGLAYRYGMNKPSKYQLSYALPMSGIPNGTYEFTYGRAHKILWQGISKELPPSHPLYSFSIPRLIALFNAGMEFDRRFLQTSAYLGLSPSRYAYFRAGDLFVAGTSLFDKRDPALMQFVEEELRRKAEPPFVDSGPPLNKRGGIDREFIKKYGITLPEKHYLALGDNYAMSSDSRDFGFVPQGNIKGAPGFIFWPPGHRFGAPNQPPYPWINLPRALVWSLAAILILGWWLYQRRRYSLSRKVE